MTHIIQGVISQIYQSPRLSRKYVGSFVVTKEWATNYPELVRQWRAALGEHGPVRVYDVFEGWGCPILEHYPGMQGVHVGRFLEKESL